MLRGALAVEDRPGGGGKGAFARPVPLVLHSLPGFAELDCVPLLIILQLPLVLTSFIWTKIAGFRKLFHLSPSKWFAFTIHHLPATLNRETIEF